MIPAQTNAHERISLIQGQMPLLFVAPHGSDVDDKNTGLIAEMAAKTSKGFAVINWGFQKSDHVDVSADFADCNKITHCHEEVVKEEFLDPILRFKSRILNNIATQGIMNKRYHRMFIFFIHGMGHQHRVLSGNPKLDIVLGYGAGDPESYSCDLWKKDLMIYLLQGAGFVTFQGRANGAFSGWGRNNMNQLFTRKYVDSKVDSMQLEIIHDLRSTSSTARSIGEYLGLVAMDLLGRNQYLTSYQAPEY